MTARHCLVILILLSGPLNATQPGPAPRQLVNMIPRSLSGETNQDSEPFLAVNPVNRQLMSASAFTVDPAAPPAIDTAPIFLSRDGGETWTLNSTVPSRLTTADITQDFDGAGTGLYVGILALPMTANTTVYKQLTSPDFTSSTPMNQLVTREKVDQPFVRATTISGSPRVYVGLNDFQAEGGRTATIDYSLDGKEYHTVRLETRATVSQNGPSVRPAVAKNGTVYAAFFGWRKFIHDVATADVVVVRDDKGGANTPAFRSLKDPADGMPGRIVVSNVSIPWENGPALGQQRIGSTLSLAVDPNDSKMVYLAWGDRVGGGDTYTIHVRKSIDSGATWSKDLLTLKDAVNVALAIADAPGHMGTVGVLYQQLRHGRWATVLLQSIDGFKTPGRETLLARPPADDPQPDFQPYLGDYILLTEAGDEFRGVFSAANVPDRHNFPSGVRYQRTADFQKHLLLNGSQSVRFSIDPFYFSVPVAH